MSLTFGDFDFDRSDSQLFSLLFYLKALVIAPTREIAVQGSRLALDIAGPGMSELKVQTFIGGIAVAQDEIKLKKCHLAIGTPGNKVTLQNYL